MHAPWSYPAPLGVPRGRRVQLVSKGSRYASIWFVMYSAIPPKYSTVTGLGFSRITLFLTMGDRLASSSRAARSPSLRPPRTHSGPKWTAMDVAVGEMLKVAQLSPEKRRSRGPRCCRCSSPASIAASSALPPLPAQRSRRTRFETAKSSGEKPQAVLRPGAALVYGLALSLVTTDPIDHPEPRHGPRAHRDCGAGAPSATASNGR
jgi:hypothetical protein